MSHDLGVSDSRRVRPLGDAHRWMDAEEAGESPYGPDYENVRSPILRAFMDELSTRWPALYNVSDDEVDDSPWNSSLLANRPGVLTTDCLNVYDDRGGRVPSGCATVLGPSPPA